MIRTISRWAIGRFVLARNADEARRWIAWIERAIARRRATPRHPEERIRRIDAFEGR